MSVFCQWGSPPKTWQERQVEMFLEVETKFSATTLQRNKSIVKHLIDNLFWKFLSTHKNQWHGLEPELPIISGSVPEGLKVVEPDEFDIMFPFRLGSESRVWSIRRRDEENSEHRPKFQPYSVTKVRPNHEDQDTIKHYGKDNNFEISPVKFYQHAKQIMLECLKAIPTNELDYQYSLQGNSDNSPAVTINVHDVLFDRYILVDLVPALEVVTEVGRSEDGWFFNKTVTYYVDKTILMVAKAKDDSWRRSYSLEEHRWSHQCKNALYDVLKVIKTLAYKKSMTPLKNFDSYVYKNALFNFASTYDMNVGTTLDEVLEDFIRYLIHCFETGTVRGYYERDTNLLAKIDTENVQSVRNYLSSLQDDLWRGLKLNRVKHPLLTQYHKILQNSFETFYKIDVRQNARLKQLASQVGHVEMVVKRLLETHFEQKNFRNRFKVNFSHLELGSKYLENLTLPNYDHIEIDVVFKLNENTWIAENANLGDGSYNCHCVGNYPRGTRQATRFGSDSDKYLLDCVKFTQRAMKEIGKAFRVYFCHDVLFHLDFKYPSVDVRFDLNSSAITWHVLPAITFQGRGSDLIGPHYPHEEKPSTSWFFKHDEKIKRCLELDKFDSGCRTEVLETLLVALSSTILKIIDRDVFWYLVYLRRLDYRWCLKPYLMVEQILDDLREIFEKGTWDKYLDEMMSKWNLNPEDLENAKNYLRTFEGAYDLFFYRKYHDV